MSDADLLTLIRSQPSLQALADAGRDAALADAVPALASVTQPKPFTSADILGCVSDANKVKVATSAMYFGIQQSIQTRDAVGILNEAALCVAAGFITSAEATAIAAKVNATESIPDTSVTHEQVSRVLNAIRPRGHFDASGNFTADASGPVRARPINWDAL